MNRIEPNRNVYVGHRYVPLLVGEWDKSIQYEGLSIVTFKGASYTSKKRTPAGIDIENEEFWVVTGNYNAQVEYYRDDVNSYRDEVDGYKEDTDVQIQDLNDDIENHKSEVNQSLESHKSEVNSNLESYKSEVNQSLESKMNETKSYVDDSIEEVVKKVYPENLDNDSIYLNDIFNSGYKNFLIKEGIYNIDDDIQIPSNVTIEWEPGSIFKKVPSSETGYNILYLERSKNVTLINPNIIGDKYSHIGDSGEWGMGINCAGTENIKINGARISECWGDGIYLGVVSNGQNIEDRYCKDTYLDNVICDDNRRNGLSIISVKNLYIDNSQFNNTRGTDPQAGIDIEPNGPSNFLDNININNVTLKNNSRRGLFFCLWLFYGDKDTSPHKNATIYCNNVTAESGEHGFETLMGLFTDPEAEDVKRNAIRNLSGEIILENCKSVDNGRNGIRLFRWYDEGVKIKFNNHVILRPNQENGTTAEHHSAISMYDPNNSTTPSTYHLGGVEINNPTIIHSINDNFKRSVNISDTTNNNPVRNFFFRNPIKINGVIRLINPLDKDTSYITDYYSQLINYINDDQRPIDQYEMYYSVISNKETTNDKNLYIDAEEFHNEEITFINESSNNLFKIRCTGSQTLEPFNASDCDLVGYGSKLTVKRIDNNSFVVLDHVNGSFI